ncbi:MerR family transcriptional regulator [Sulfitobacter geojensis]|uniref:MerR family transcriptional regulator n=1 Tax=Sulfitobacter geojensis TaxID=1342299 RepID=UPI00046A2856|nr:MerR family transcriptional regulator [Sulfitobacter geojensis]KHA52605.1 Transcriptional regulator, MerR family [Sulfitobacter geojensis]NYI28718.1 DNA-binding transcriptional MerR regulator [Sulfitobacter geojensis]
MAKSADAFRTISEVADWLGIQAHVLRFWESKFTQVRPVKRAGGRRYYRPNDMLLLGGIKQLLHEDGLTIKGVQKILREEGMNHVAALSQPLDELTQSLLDESPPTPFIDVPEEAQEETGVVLNFDKKTQPVEDTAETVAPAADPVVETAPVEDTATPDDASSADAAAVETVKDEAPQTARAEGEAAPAVDNAAAPSQTDEEAGPAADVQPETVADVPESLTAEDAKDASPADAAAHVSQEESAEAQTELPAQSAPQDGAAPEPAQTSAPASADQPEEAAEEAESVEPAQVNEHITIVEPAPMARPEPVFEKVPLVADELEDQPETAESTEGAAEESPAPVDATSEETSQPSQDVVEADEDETATDDPEQEESAPADDDTAALPAFLRRSVADADQPDVSDNMPVDGATDDSVTVQDAPDADAGPEPAQAPHPAAPKPRVIDMPAFTPEHEISAAPAVLSAAFTCKQLNTTQARKIAPLLEKLTVLRDSMAATRPGARQTGAASPSND